MYEDGNFNLHGNGVLSTMPAFSLTSYSNEIVQHPQCSFITSEAIPSLPTFTVYAGCCSPEICVVPGLSRPVVGIRRGCCFRSQMFNSYFNLSDWVLLYLYNMSLVIQHFHIVSVKGDWLRSVFGWEERQYITLCRLHTTLYIILSFTVSYYVRVNRTNEAGSCDNSYSWVRRIMAHLVCQRLLWPSRAIGTTALYACIPRFSLPWPLYRRAKPHGGNGLP